MLDPSAMNFSRDIVDAADPGATALIELGRDGSRRRWSFGDVAGASNAFATTLSARGVARGDVVMTLIGNRSEWVLTMVACFRIGAVVLPCTEQLRAKDLRLRLDAVTPRVVVADERNRTVLEQALALPAATVGPAPEVLLVPDPDPLRRLRTAGPGGRPGPDRRLPDHVHQRHLGDRQAGPARAALPDRPATPGRALAGRRCR